MSGNAIIWKKCLTINFNLILTIILIFVTVNIHDILLWLNAGTEMAALMVNDILNNALFHSSSSSNQTLHQILHVLHFCTMDSLLNYAPDFVVSWIEVRAVRRPLSWKFMYRGDHDLWDYYTFGVEAASDAQTVWVNTACGKEHSQKNLSKPILWYRNE